MYVASETATADASIPTPDWFSPGDLRAEFLEPELRRVLADPTLRVTSIACAPMYGSGNISRTQRRLAKFVGTYALRVTCTGAGGDRIVPLWLKSKPLDEETMLSFRTSMVRSPRLLDAWQAHGHNTELVGSHDRELLVAEHFGDQRFLRHVPRVVKSYRDPVREAYVLVFEQLDQAVLMDAFDDVDGWTAEHVDTVLRGLGEIHAIWYGRDDLTDLDWVHRMPDAAYHDRTRPLWDALAEHMWEVAPGLDSPAARAVQRTMLGGRRDWATELCAMPRTLIHSNLTPRNLALRQVHGELRLTLYDWETVSVGVPQHDLAQFLCWTLTPAVTRTEVDHFVELHRSALEAASGATISAAQWRHGYALSLRDVYVRKLPFLVVSRRYRNAPATARVLATIHRLLELG